MKKFVSTMFTCISVLFLTGLTVQASPIVAFNLLDTTVEINDTFSLDIIGTGFSDPMFGGGLDFSFNQSVLQVNNVAIDPTSWEFATLDAIIDNTNGTVSDILFSSFFNLPSGDFTIATVEFSVISNGFSSLSLSNSTTPNPFISIAGPVPVDFINGSVTAINTAPNPAPEPATILLVGIGIAGLSFLNRKQIRKS